MYSRTAFIVVVCLAFIGSLFAANAPAWTVKQAAFVEAKQRTEPPVSAQTKPITKVKKRIVKCRPLEGAYDPAVRYALPYDCILPIERPRSWEIDAQVLFARAKGQVRFYQGATATYSYYGLQDVDLNADLGVPDHGVVPTFTARYRFRPRWSLRYSVMPLVLEQTGRGSGRNLSFGNITTLTSGQDLRTKWEHLYQRVGLVYDPIRTYKARVSVFGDYVRVDDKLSVVQVGCCGSTMFNDLNMGMAGLEFERCLKTTRNWNTLSLECRAGLAFGDEAFGGDMSGGVKYTIALGNGRWGYLKGGYRYLTYKKKYSDARLLDTCVEGGYLQMGFVF